MASRYSKIQSTLFSSEKFQQLNEFQKNVYIYLLICPHGNSAGLFKLKEGYATTDLKCSTQRYRNALDKLKEVGLIEHFDEIIFIYQFLKFNSYTNPKHAQGSVKEIQEYIDTPLYILLYNDIKAYCIDYIDEFPEPKKPIESLSKAYREGISTKTNTNTKTNNKTKTIGGGGDSRYNKYADIVSEEENPKEKQQPLFTEPETLKITKVQLKAYEEFEKYFKTESIAFEFINKQGIYELVEAFGYPAVSKAIEKAAGRIPPPEQPLNYIKSVTENKEFGKVPP
jgi:hypothetical protein